MNNTETITLALICTSTVDKANTVEVNINNNKRYHVFEYSGETHRFVLDTVCIPGSNLLSLKTLGNIVIQDLCIHGCSIGFDIFSCFYENSNGNVSQSLLHIEDPGMWHFDIKIPIAENYRGVGIG